MKIIKNILSFLVKIFLSIILLLFFIGVLPYLFTNIYDFPSEKIFKGKNFYNPYSVSDTSNNWYKANFQAHSGAWGGLTDGRIKPIELYKIYSDLGYDIIVLTNYQTITPMNWANERYIPAYEHGYNIKKRHHLCIGAKEVVWWDYIFFQNIHHKQDILKKLHNTAEINAISHPEFSKSFNPSDFSKLTDIDFIEILNHYRLSLKHWDSSLSAGRLAWGMGNDDSHDQRDTNETGKFWNMILSNSTSAPDIIKALKSGSNYCVGGNRGYNDNQLKYINLSDNSAKIKLQSPAMEIRFIGQKGDTLKRVFNSDSAYYSIKDSDTYIRIEAENKATVMYFNPLFRYEYEPFSKESATVNLGKTWFYRLIVLLVLTGIFYLLTTVLRKRKTNLKNA